MYIIIFLIGIILALINDRRRISLKVFTIIIAILAFLRYGVGSDYFAYEYLYNRLSASLIVEVTNGLDNQEHLFRLLGSFLKKLGLSYQHYLVVIASVNIYFVYKLCNKYSKNPTLSMLLYYCFYYLVWTFSGLRQGIVLAVGVYYLLDCLEKKKNMKFLVIVTLLSFIHTTAILLLLLYFIGRLNITKRKLIYLSCLSVVMSLIPFGKILVSLTWIPFANRLTPYLDTDVSIINMLDFQSIARLIFLFIALFYYDEYCKQNDISKKIINIYIVGLIIYFIFKFSELTAARLSIYGRMLDIIILTNVYYLYKDKLNRIIYIYILFILFTISLFKEIRAMDVQSNIIYAEDKIFIPYTSIFNKNEFIFNKDTYQHVNN